MVAHRSGICKAPGCNKTQWKDGYCRNCGQYELQKQIAENLNNLAGLMAGVVSGLATMDKKISAINSVPSPVNIPSNDENKSESGRGISGAATIRDNLIPKTENSPLKKDSEMFIPSIQISDNESNIRQKSRNSNQGLMDIAKQLQSISMKG